MTPDEKSEVQPEPMNAGDLTQMAHDYHVPMTTQTIDSIVGKGELSPEKSQAFLEYVQRQAQGLYPTLAPQIAQGLKTSDLLEPYRQVAKQVLGQDFEPNFQTDPRMRAALQGSQDPATGRPSSMTLDQWQQHLKSEPSLGWKDTPQGRAETLAVKQKMLAALHG